MSRRVGLEFAHAWRRVAPGAGYVHRDLRTQPVPHITEEWTEICDQLMTAGITDVDRLHEVVATPGQKRAWEIVAPLLQEVVGADVILICTPMHNYSIPSVLKAWLDQITFPRMNLAPREFVIVAARGGDYRAGAPKASVEHQTTYLTDFVQGHFAVGRPKVIAVELGNATVDPLLAERRREHEISLAAALDAANRMPSPLVSEVAA